VSGLLDVTVDFDISDLESTYDRGRAELVANVKKAVRAAATEGLAEAIATRRYHDRTGHLTGTARTRLIESTIDGAKSEIEWPVAYADAVDGGTRPHVIEAKNAPLLRFYWPKIGGLFVGKRVNHPGTQPTGFAGVAYHKAERVIERDVSAAIRQLEVVLSH
jgi:hypothetical protein